MIDQGTARGWRCPQPSTAGATIPARSPPSRWPTIHGNGPARVEAPGPLTMSDQGGAEHQHGGLGGSTVRARSRASCRQHARSSFFVPPIQAAHPHGVAERVPASGPGAGLLVAGWPAGSISASWTQRRPRGAGPRGTDHAGRRRARACPWVTWATQPALGAHGGRCEAQAIPRPPGSRPGAGPPWRLPPGFLAPSLADEHPGESRPVCRGEGANCSGDGGQRIRSRSGAIAFPFAPPGPRLPGPFALPGVRRAIVIVLGFAGTSTGTSGRWRRRKCFTVVTYVAVPMARQAGGRWFEPTIAHFVSD
jgi:hypothetical protein